MATNATFGMLLIPKIDEIKLLLSLDSKYEQCSSSKT
jgi:hypothetical protein